MTTTDEALQMIADCEARESRLGEWEAAYIDSIRRQFERGHDYLTARQEETLKRIWKEVTER